MRTLHWRSLLIIVAMAICSSATWAADAGRVLVVSGSAWLERDGVKQRIIRRSRVEQGDIVTTGPNSTVKWWMPDDSIYAIGSDSQMKISTYRLFRAERERGRGFGELALDLVKGSFRSITGFIGSRNRNAYQVRTPVATMGIRGTDYTLIYMDATEATARGLSPGLYVSVTSGAVVLSNSSGVEVTVGEGQFGFVANDSSQPFLVDQVPAGLQEAFAAQQLKFGADFFQGLTDQITITEEPPASPS